MILGIYHPATGHGHDTGVALVDSNARIIAAMSEERLSRVKMDGGFPFRAIEMVLRIGGVKPSDLKAVAVPYMSAGDQIAEGGHLLTAALSQPSLIKAQFEYRSGRDAFQAGMSELGAYGYLDEFNRRVAAVRTADGRPAVSNWREFLNANGLGDVPVVQLDHHLAHAAEA